MAKSSESSNNLGKICPLLIAASFILGGLGAYIFLGSNNGVRCDGFKEPSFQGICYTNLAIDKKDASICGKLSGLASINGCYKEVAIASVDSSICDKVDDGLLRDSCYSRVGALAKDKSVCDKISDISQKNGCYSEIGIGGSANPPKNQSNAPAPSMATNDTGKNTKPVKDYRNQNVSIISVYRSGNYLFFQIKAPFANNVSIDMKDITFLAENTTYPVGPWTGGVDGTMCISISQLTPGQNCFGRIENVTCYLGDDFRLVLPGGFIEEKEISGCSFR